MVKKGNAKAKYLPNGLKHKEKSHRSIMGPRDLGPRARGYTQAPAIVFFRGFQPFIGV